MSRLFLFCFSSGILFFKVYQWKNKKCYTKKFGIYTEAKLIKKDYFKGWYFKCCIEDKTIALIPAYHRNNNRETASLQIITDNEVFNVPFDSLKFSNKPLIIKIGNCCFSEKGIKLNIQNNNLNIITPNNYSAWSIYDCSIIAITSSKFIKMFKKQLCIAISQSSKICNVMAQILWIIHFWKLHIHRNPQPLFLNYYINEICINLIGDIKLFKLSFDIWWQIHYTVIKLIKWAFRRARYPSFLLFLNLSTTHPRPKTCFALLKFSSFISLNK